MLNNFVQLSFNSLSVDELQIIVAAVESTFLLYPYLEIEQTEQNHLEQMVIDVSLSLNVPANNSSPKHTCRYLLHSNRR